MLMVACSKEKWLLISACCRQCTQENHLEEMAKRNVINFARDMLYVGCLCNFKNLEFKWFMGFSRLTDLGFLIFPFSIALTWAN